jgi:peptidoglycan/LPS O-acetylase OafA/YrhL
MVIAVHSSQYFDDLPYGVQKLADQGARGVQLFFVASALTLCMSWKDRHDGALPFYVRRFFRIAPMFYLAIAFFIWARGFGPGTYAPDGIGLRHVLMAATFTHGLMPDTITSLVPGSWSVADEMMFYAMFPLLIAALSRVRFAMAAVVTALVTWLLYRAHQPLYRYEASMTDPAWQSVWSTFTYLWLPQQFPCFLFGMLVFKWTDEGHAVKWARPLVILSLAAMVWIAFFPGTPFVGRLSMPVQYGFLFALFALGLSHWSPVALVNPVVGWIGKVSYSGYLIHLALISTLPISPANFAQSFTIIATATIALSSLTYLLIEIPFNRIGRRVAGRLAKRSAGIEPASAEAYLPAG